MGRGPLAGGRSGSPGTAAMTLRAAVLAPGRREIAILGVLGQWGSRAAGERCPALPGLPEHLFFSLGLRFTGSQ
ncbi:hypothetical protein CRG98_039940 [Punica granatum]|uniref:Uncharacterized protein n=1 Tax=Punica granatum TaxID=22663 RepID=A0A2I0I7M5_PUNGR|nr:hypothetical protein CRG98_039940 [Punica granatum]